MVSPSNILARGKRSYFANCTEAHLNTAKPTILSFASYTRGGIPVLVQLPSHVQKHIETIAKHEQDFFARRTLAERIADKIAAFAGNFKFVLLHLSVFCGWIVWNTSHLVPHFDAIPFPLLATSVALEALLLASIILMRQSGLGKRADERDHLMLQVLLLVEREMSAVIQMNREFADRLNLPAASDQEIQELAQPTPIDNMAQKIQENLSRE